MYLFIGGSTIVRTRDIVGIFDLDTSTISQTTKNFVRMCEKNGLSDSATPNLPKSFILSAENPSQFKIQYSQISAKVLIERNAKGIF
jgi:hypothetical protein